MCLLHFGNDHDGGIAVKYTPRFERRGNRPLDGRQHLPLRNPPSHRARNTKSGEDHERDQAMNKERDSATPLEPERYELSAPPSYRFAVDRREFFKFLGAGVLVVCVLKD